MGARVLFPLQKVIPAQYLDENTVYHIQPSGSFVIGGPQVHVGGEGVQCTERCCTCKCWSEQWLNQIVNMPEQDPYV